MSSASCEQISVAATSSAAPQEHVAKENRKRRLIITTTSAPVEPPAQKLRTEPVEQQAAESDNEDNCDFSLEATAPPMPPSGLTGAPENGAAVGEDAQLAAPGEQTEAPCLGLSAEDATQLHPGMTPGPSEMLEEMVQPPIQSPTHARQDPPPAAPGNGRAKKAFPSAVPEQWNQLGSGALEQESDRGSAQSAMIDGLSSLSSQLLAEEPAPSNIRGHAQEYMEPQDCPFTDLGVRAPEMPIPEFSRTFAHDESLAAKGVRVAQEQGDTEAREAHNMQREGHQHAAPAQQMREQPTSSYVPDAAEHWDDSGGVSLGALAKQDVAAKCHSNQSHSELEGRGHDVGDHRVAQSARLQKADPSIDAASLRPEEVHDQLYRQSGQHCEDSGDASSSHHDTEQQNPCASNFAAAEPRVEANSSAPSHSLDIGSRVEHIEEDGDNEDIEELLVQSMRGRHQPVQVRNLQSANPEGSSQNSVKRSDNHGDFALTRKGVDVALQEAGECTHGAIHGDNERAPNQRVEPEQLVQTSRDGWQQEKQKARYSTEHIDVSGPSEVVDEVHDDDSDSFEELLARSIHGGRCQQTSSEEPQPPNPIGVGEVSQKPRSIIAAQPTAAATHSDDEAFPSAVPEQWNQLGSGVLEQESDRDSAQSANSDGPSSLSSQLLAEEPAPSNIRGHAQEYMEPHDFPVTALGVRAPELPIPEYSRTLAHDESLAAKGVRVVQEQGDTEAREAHNLQRAEHQHAAPAQRMREQPTSAYVPDAAEHWDDSGGVSLGALAKQDVAAKGQSNQSHSEQEGRGRDVGFHRVAQSACFQKADPSIDAASLRPEEVRDRLFRQSGQHCEDPGGASRSHHDTEQQNHCARNSAAAGPRVEANSFAPSHSLDIGSRVEHIEEDGDNDDIEELLVQSMRGRHQPRADGALQEGGECTHGAIHGDNECAPNQRVEPGQLVETRRDGWQQEQQKAPYSTEHIDVSGPSEVVDEVHDDDSDSIEELLARSIHGGRRQQPSSEEPQPPNPTGVGEVSQKPWNVIAPQPTAAATHGDDEAALEEGSDHIEELLARSMEGSRLCDPSSRRHHERERRLSQHSMPQIPETVAPAAHSWGVTAVGSASAGSGPAHVAAVAINSGLSATGPASPLLDLQHSEAWRASASSVRQVEVDPRCFGSQQSDPQQPRLQTSTESVQMSQSSQSAVQMSQSSQSAVQQFECTYQLPSHVDEIHLPGQASTHFRSCTFGMWLERDLGTLWGLSASVIASPFQKPGASCLQICTIANGGAVDSWNIKAIAEGKLQCVVQAGDYLLRVDSADDGIRMKHALANTNRKIIYLLALTVRPRHLPTVAPSPPPEPPSNWQNVNAAAAHQHHVDVPTVRQQHVNCATAPQEPDDAAVGQEHLVAAQNFGGRYCWCELGGGYWQLMTRGTHCCVPWLEFCMSSWAPWFLVSVALQHKRGRGGEAFRKGVESLLRPAEARRI